MTTEPASQSYLTLGAIAALAFIAACVGHEAIGHGGACLLLGGRITLLSSVYFHCTNGSGVIDAAGPLMNLLLGGVCWVALKRWPLRWENGKLFLVVTMALNLFWGSGYFIHSAVTDSGDLAFVLHDLALQPAWLWRGLMGVLGLYLYYRSLELVDVYLPAGTPLLLPYFVAGIVSCAAVLFFAGAIRPALIDAARESFGANVGLLLLAYRRTRRARPAPSIRWMQKSDRWVVAAALVTLVFFLTLGRGFVASARPNERLRPAVTSP